jgi:murein DD-endopeptidase MepM/ murein hydrolase activator NlpD
MPKYIKYLILIILLTVIASYAMWRPSLTKIKLWQHDDVLAEPAVANDKTVKVQVGDGDSYGNLMTTAGIPASTANSIYEAALDLYDLAKVRVGRDLELIYDVQTNQFKQFVYKIDSEDELIVTLTYPKQEESTDDSINSEADQTIVSDPAEVILVINEPEWKAKIVKIPYDVKQKTVNGEVSSSLYQSALDHGMDDRAIINLANAYQWTIDFAMDSRVGDKYTAIYEERYLDEQDMGSGNILAAKYLNAGTPYYIFYFEESEDNKGFFDENGNSVQKMFLRAPVEFRYISSGYTTGTRVVMEVGLIGAHRAIDYAAASGTPIRAVGAGIVASTGWSGCYGNLTTIRHNGTYTTRYAHQSKFAVKVGQRVKQGDIIGYVGSTGCSTGPHVHFEMIKNGAQINPLEEILPPGKAIMAENQDRFKSLVAKYKTTLDQE